MNERSNVATVGAVVVIIVIVALAGALLLQNSSANDRDEVSPNNNLIYNGTEQDLVTVKDSGKNILFSLDGSEYTTTIPSATNAGIYAITYKISNADEELEENGELRVEIHKKEASVSAPEITKQYGETDPKLECTVVGVLEGDSIDYVVSRVSGESVGTYAINVTGESDQGNYVVTFKNGTMKIGYREAVVSANSASKVYGSKDPTLTATEVGVLGTDKIQYTLNRTPGEEVGAHNIIVSGEEVQGNYHVKFENSVLYIYEKTVTVSANNASKKVGDSDPTLTATVSGGTGIKYTITREAGEDVGTYRIHVTGDSMQGNYYVTYQDATFSIMTTSSSWTKLPTKIDYQ